MYLIGAVVIVLCAFSTSVQAGWLEELTLGRGLKLGSGISLHLDRLKRENASLLERHALRVDYSGIGLSVGKALNKDAVQVGLYMGDGVVEGRKRKIGDIILPAMIGFKTTGIAAMTFTAVTLLVFKAIGIAKLAILVSAGLFIAKYLLHHRYETASYMGIEPPFAHHPMYEFPSAAGYSPSASTNYLAYANYGNSGVEGGETEGQYAIVEATSGNSSVVSMPANKRHDFVRRKLQPTPLFTVQKYTIEHD